MRTRSSNMLRRYSSLPRNLSTIPILQSGLPLAFLVASSAPFSSSSSSSSSSSGKKQPRTPPSSFGEGDDRPFLTRFFFRFGQFFPYALLTCFGFFVATCMVKNSRSSTSSIFKQYFATRLPSLGGFNSEDDLGTALLEAVCGPSASTMMMDVLKRASDAGRLSDVLRATRERDGSTALMLAAANCDLDVVSSLLFHIKTLKKQDQVAIASAKTKQLGMNCLHLAGNDVAIIQAIADNFPHLLVAESNDGAFPIHIASFIGRSVACAALLDAAKTHIVASASANGSSSNNHNDNDDLLFSRMMLHHDKHGYNPLHVAVVRGHKAVVQIMVDAGADIGARSAAGRTAEELTRNDEILEILRSGSSSSRKKKSRGFFF